MFGYNALYVSTMARVTLGFAKDGNRQRFSLLVEGSVKDLTVPGMTRITFDFESQEAAMEYAKGISEMDDTLVPVGDLREEEQPATV